MTMKGCYVTTGLLILTQFYLGIFGDECSREPTETAALKTGGDNGFRIKFAGRPPPERYVPNHVYTGKSSAMTSCDVTTWTSLKFG